MDEFISNFHDELMIPMVSQLCLYNECMENIEVWKKKSYKVKDLKKKLDTLESSSNREEAKIAKVREVLSDLESTRSSLVDTIREDVSKYTDKPIEERAEKMVNILKDYVKEVKEKIQEKAAPKASTSKAADALD
ncbi:hypothetical protein TNIN_60151, partial [Trichonephila inaurata madagascariensis]